MKRAATACALAVAAFAQQPGAMRLKQNPLISQQLSPTLGDDINGPSVIRVPAWVQNPLGRYYLYFAHHKGKFIRLAYADKPEGPWKIYEPGVLKVEDTEFYRPQPDPPAIQDNFYTHVASPEVVIDEENHRFVMLVHGHYTAGERWPATMPEANRWSREKGYGQYSQTTTSTDGLHFTPRPGITARTSYVRLFRRDGFWYGMSRLGLLSRTPDLTGKFEPGPNPFDETPYRNRVRHVAVAQRDQKLYVFFSAIGDAPERMMLSTIDMTADWRQWRASEAREILRPQAAYECTNLPIAPSRAGEAEGPEQAVRDPGLLETDGRVLMFYSYCAEQGLAAADVTSLIK